MPIRLRKSVVEVTPSSSTQIQVSSSLSGPSGLAVDPAGSVFIADTGNLRLIKVPNENGALNANDQYQVGQTIAKPYGVVLSPAGNLYITDSADASVSQIVRTQGTLDLGRANVNVATSTLSSQIASSGNQNLTFGTPLYASTDTSSLFAITAPNSGGCVAGQTLNPGFSCVLNASFTPAVRGSFSDVLSFSSTPVNTSAPQLTVLGVGTFLATTQLSLAVTAPTSAPVLGQPVTITAAITSTNGGGSVPTGTVSFLLDGNPVGGLKTVGNGRRPSPSAISPEVSIRLGQPTAETTTSPPARERRFSSRSADRPALPLWSSQEAPPTRKARLPVLPLP